MLLKWCVVEAIENFYREDAAPGQNYRQICKNRLFDIWSLQIMMQSWVLWNFFDLRQIDWNLDDLAAHIKLFTKSTVDQNSWLLLT